VHDPPPLDYDAFEASGNERVFFALRVARPVARASSAMALKTLNEVTISFRVFRSADRAFATLFPLLGFRKLPQTKSILAEVK